MWLSLKITVFYGAPVAAVLAAMVLMVVLLMRVRAGRVRRRGAALLYLWAWLLPAASLLLIVFTAELAGYLSSTLIAYRWDVQRVQALVLGLMPVGGIVAAAVIVLHLILLAVLALLPRLRKA